jgi:hypothetical protein
MIFEFEELAVGVGGARKLAALAPVDVDFRRREPVGGASFDFDEAECLLIVSDEIEFGVYDSAAQVTADGKREVCGDQSVTELFEIRGGVLLA